MQFSNLKSWIWLSLLIVTATLGVFWVNGLGPAQKATPEECAVYRAFYDYIPDKTDTFFRPLTFHQQKLSFLDQAPRLFSRFTGETDEITLAPNTETITVEKSELYKKDTTNLFEQLPIREPVSIKPCFTQAGKIPDFHTFGPQTAKLRVFIKSGKGRPFPMLWTVSAIGMSSDASYALLYAENNCGGLCAGGSFYLLEKIDGEWIVYAVRGVWIS